MSKKKQNAELRNKKIVNEFNRLDGIKTKRGKNVYSYAAILEKLADKFYLEPLTIQRILKK